MECIYCGSIENIEYDHIPPKCLFQKPRPSNLITVPCCRVCNGSASKDDEYFKQRIIMNADLEDNPAVNELLPKVHKAFSRQNSMGFTKSLIQDAKYGPTYTKSGIYLGNQLTYNVDLDRIGKVVSRIVKGLYYHNFEKRLSENNFVDSFYLGGFGDRESEIIERLSPYLKIFRNLKAQIIDKNVFSYKYILVDSNECTRVWLLTFYKKVQFICLIVPIKKEGEQSLNK